MSRKIPGSAIVPGTITITQISGDFNDTSNAAYGQANAARIQANTARDQANTARTTANDSYGAANTAQTNALNAYGQANSGVTIAGNAYGQANNSRDQANTGRTQANAAYGQANSARDQANTAYGQANAAYGAANSRLLSTGGTLSGDLIITGNLTVSGNQTILNTEVLTTEDAEIILLSNTSSTPALNAGLIVNRGTSTNTFLRWNEAVDEWGWSDNGTTTYYFDDLRQGLGTTNTTFGTLNTTFGTINTSLGTINTSYQAAYAQANTAGTNALNAYGQANAARTQANSARDQANSGVTIGGNAYAQANSARTQANSAYSAANAAFTVVFTANIDANVARTAGSYGSYASAATNTPTNSGILLNLLSGSDGSSDGWQLWTDYNANGNLYTRRRWGGGWSTWAQIWGEVNSPRPNTVYTQANTAYGQANLAYGQANSAYGAANNRVLKAGDTMTGNLIISAAAGAGSATFAGGVSLLRIQGSTSAYSEPRIDLGEQSLSPTAYIASKNEGNGGGSLIFGNRNTSSSSSTLTERMRINSSGGFLVGTTTLPTNMTNVLVGPTQIQDVTTAGGEFSDWPVPSFSIRSYDDFTQNTMLAFLLRDDTAYSTASDFWNIRIGHVGGQLTSNTSTYLRLNGPGQLVLNSFGNDRINLYSDNSTESTSFRAPIFYDSNDTGYYVNPNGTTKGYDIWAYNRLYTGSNQNYININYDQIWRPDNGQLHLQYSGSGSINMCNGGGSVHVVNNFYAPIMYDGNDTAYYANPNGGSRFWTITPQVIYPGGPGGDSLIGNQSYAIYQEGGAWTHPYPDLAIAYHTGIKIGAYYGYNGTRFYNNNDMATQIASVGDGDNNFRSYYNIIAYASDGRLKENIQPITNAIEKVKKITGMTFDWKPMVKDLGFEPNNIHEAGVIAQEIEAVLPEAVEIAPFDYDWKMPNKSKSGEKYLTVKYEKIVPLLIQAIKEQQEQIEELKNLIKEKLS
jgi:hypothetical protein